jgi:hypothetical protein
MKATTREQIDFLKKRIHRGEKSKQLRAAFKKRWKLSTVTYNRRVAAARAEIKAGSGAAPAAFVLLSFRQPENHDQFPAKKQEQKTAAENNQLPIEKDDQPSTQIPLENKAAPDSPKTAKESYQQAVKKDDQPTKLSAEIIAATEKLLCTTVLHTDDCLFLLTRFALGQFVRQREVNYKGEAMQLNETPNFSQRRAAVNTIMKYHAAAKGLAGNSDEKYIDIDPAEFANMSDERFLELSLQFQEMHRKK